MQLRITHTTRYHYAEPVHAVLQQLRLTPKSRAGQNVIAWSTTVEGGISQLQYDDEHNNHVELVSFEDGRTDITVLCEGEVENTNSTGVIGAHGGFAPLWLFRKATPLTRAGNNVRKLVKSVGGDFGDGDVARLHDLSNAIVEQVEYRTGQTEAGTTGEEALDIGYGVCQDHAHIFIAAARAMGYPARYVSGYLMMNDRVEQDASHAWAEAHVDGLGWVGFDVSNRISPDERYVRVATGLDYTEAAPVSGLRRGTGEEKMDVTLQVQQQ
ncbi:transglutaminase family protein [Oricola cellulosilytica]|uniref:Transglutaminase family protein n=1 Tax=Oricola cellulosilytica TaxID=1429082 RepID=A0A4R0PML5_9HYPH|nr:transglutaminase family protein [Oricola cellulosilytica]TCD16559.1 transglutaminase family protein [Oricola cellulosilytica]